LISPTHLQLRDSPAQPSVEEHGTRRKSQESFRQRRKAEATQRIHPQTYFTQTLISPTHLQLRDSPAQPSVEEHGTRRKSQESFRQRRKAEATQRIHPQTHFTQTLISPKHLLKVKALCKRVISSHHSHFF